MIKGLYAAASAMLANLNRQGALAHNVSNLDTPGFKQLMVSMDEFTETEVIDPPGPTASPRQLRLIGDLGLGVETRPEGTDFTEGGMRYTGQPLDLAVNGEGFFRVQTPDGERYTRDGRFQRDSQGNLVTVDGYKVLSDGGQPINLPEGDITVTMDGTVMVAGKAAGKIGLASFQNPETELERDLANTFASTGGAPTGTTKGTINEGYLEMSNASPAEIMTQMVAVTRAYEAAQRMVQTQDELLGKSIANLGGF
jgi:flagellar basal-body rod protein FlgF